MWQDIALAIISIFLSYAMFPQVIRGFKAKKKMISTQTSLITFIGMYAVTIIYFTLGLHFATVISFITGTLWLILFAQGVVYKKNL